MIEAAPTDDVSAIDAVVVGAGFGGLYALLRLRQRGWAVRSFEAGEDVGGTWYWNRYPGARCDVESVDYSYSFSEELQDLWTWTERYAAQPEIRRYLEFVADHFDLRRNITFQTRVESAVWDESSSLWQVTTDDGEVVLARYCVMAAGVLSSIKEPDFPGLESFRGQIVQTQRWPDDLELAGRRVGVIGTGSTGVQAIPKIAQQAAHLTVFQRTANFSVPARNRPLTESELADVRREYAERRRQNRYSAAGFPESGIPRSALEFTPEEREKVYESAWQSGGGPATIRAFADIGSNLESNATAADFVRAKIADIVKDPTVVAALSPTDHPIGAKRICVDTDYYATYNRDNVTLVDLKKTPIIEFVPEGVRTTEGIEEIDLLVLALGFDAVTGALVDIDIRGREGIPLSELWASGPRTYLGLGMAGFPNMFTITGPGSPSVLGNVVVSIEQHVDFMIDLLIRADEVGADHIEVLPEAQDWWASHVAERAEATLLATTNSWYRGANIEGKAQVVLPYTGGVGTFRQMCEEIAKDDFRGFDFGSGLNAPN
ncbi:NAD(P)/FAD-dependent oxidoreductase [soil metagenome]